MDDRMQEAENDTGQGLDQSELRSQAESEQRRTWDIPPGGIITNGSGYLTRNRLDTYHNKWSKVAVGPIAAGELSKGLNERDHRILLMLEQLRIMTTEQIARSFFESPTTARKRIRFLHERRFLASPEADHKIIDAAVGRRGGTHNAPLVLDWNGKYLLEHMHYDLRTWNPATVAQVNSRFGHTLGVSEVWSYIVAAARATHEHTPQPITPGIQEIAAEAARAMAQLSVGLLNERESIIYYEGRTGWSLELDWACTSTPAPHIRTAEQVEAERSKRWKYKTLVKPDATLVLSVTSNTSEKADRAYLEAVHKSNSTPSSSYQGSWHNALVNSLLSPAAMRVAEQFGNTRYKYLFLEMETGSNSSKDMMHKIDRYNQLYSRLAHGDMMHGQSWRTLFGNTLPTIVVAIRDRSQVEGQVTAWRTHYAARSAGSMLLANLELLSIVYAGGRARLLSQPCLLDVMRPDGPKWITFSEALGLKI